jgi:hypothetical protein
MAVLASLSEPLSRREIFAELKARLNSGLIAPVPIEDVVPTGVPALDRLLGGGFPRGTLVALEGDAGRWSLVARLVAQVTRRAMAAILDDGALYPPGLAEAGARLERVLVVPARTPLLVARAVDLLLRSRTCRLVVMPALALRDALWIRLAGLAHRTGALLIAVATTVSAPLAAAAGLRLYCTRERLGVCGERGPWCRFSGYDLRAHIRKSKRTITTISAQLRAADVAVC